jgi:RNA polymerase sigma factor (sigma-70 family)
MEFTRLDPVAEFEQPAAESAESYDKYFRTAFNCLRAAFPTTPADTMYDAVRYGICEWFFTAPQEVKSSLEKSRSWIIQVSRRSLMHELRRMKRLTALPDHEAAADQAVAALPDTLIDNSSRSMLGSLIVENLLTNLTSSVAEAMQLHVMDGFTVKEIAEIQYCSSSTVKKRLKTGYAKLRDIVRKEECNW